MTDNSTTESVPADTSEVDLLAFEPPTIRPQGWETAESQAFRFPQRYIAKCQELNDYAKGLAAVEQEKNHLFDFVVRNLIAAMDTLNFVFDEIGLEEPAAPSAAGESVADEPASSDEPKADASQELPQTEGEPENDILDPAGATVDSDAPGQETADDKPEETTAQPEDTLTAISEDEASITRRGLESVRRSILNILEGLHIEPVELLGKTYRGVEVNGRVIEDPFEIVEAKNQGKATEMPVLEVITSLWVQTEPGVRIIRKGQVVC